MSWRWKRSAPDWQRCSGLGKITAFYQSGWRDFTGWSTAHERKEWSGEAGGVPLFSERPRGVDGCKPDSVQRAACAERLDGHLSHSKPHGVAGSLRTATNTRRVSPLARRVGQAARSLLFCLAPHGVFRAPLLALGAVGFYSAFSPLPPGLRRGGGIFSVTLSVDRDFGPGPPRVLRGMLPCGVRTFLSLHALRPAESDRPPSEDTLSRLENFSSGDLLRISILRWGRSVIRIRDVEH